MSWLKGRPRKELDSSTGPVRPALVPRPDPSESNEEAVRFELGTE